MLRRAARLALALDDRDAHSWLDQDQIGLRVEPAGATLAGVQVDTSQHDRAIPAGQVALLNGDAERIADVLALFLRTHRRLLDGEDPPYLPVQGRRHASSRSPDACLRSIVAYTRGGRIWSLAIRFRGEAIVAARTTTRLAVFTENHARSFLPGEWP